MARPTSQREKRRAYEREYWRKHKARRAAIAMRYYWKHRESYLKKKREWYAKTRERRLSYAKSWNERNRDKLAEYHKRYWLAKGKLKSQSQERRKYRHEYAKAHLPERAAHHAKRRLLTSSVLCPRTNKIYRRAAELRKWFDVVVDHIIPLAKGGRHTSDNLQIIYRFENECKNDRVDYTPRLVFS